MKITMKYQDALHRDSVTALETAGVLGETYIDIDSSQAKAPSCKRETNWLFVSTPTSTT
jgi:hypothetical protein